MGIDEKYKKLRAALIGMVGVEDDKAVLIHMLDTLRKLDDGSADCATTMHVLVTLIETHGD